LPRGQNPMRLPPLGTTSHCPLNDPHTCDMSDLLLSLSWPRLPPYPQVHLIRAASKRAAFMPSYARTFRFASFTFRVAVSTLAERSSSPILSTCAPRPWGVSEGAGFSQAYVRNLIVCGDRDGAAAVAAMPEGRLWQLHWQRGTRGAGQLEGREVGVFSPCGGVGRACWPSGQNLGGGVR
jgi:hypothetical protein